MSRTVDKVLAVAEAEIGYLEKKSKSDLYDKTANAGRNNYTKYAYEFDTKYTGFYNGKKNGFAWCDMFVDWCFVTAFGVEDALYLLGQPKKSCGAGCKFSSDYYKKMKLFFKTPVVGDQIFFQNTKGEVVHTGLVYKVDSKYVYTIEGNTSSASGVVANGGAVAKKKYSITNTKIYGYGRPRYDTKPEDKPVATNNTEVCTVEVNVLKKGVKSDEVKAMQVLLLGYGHKMENNGKTYGADGSFGAATEKAVRSFQEAQKLSVDGVCGPKTWSKLLGIK